MVLETVTRQNRMTTIDDDDDDIGDGICDLGHDAAAAAAAVAM